MNDHFFPLLDTFSFSSNAIHCVARILNVRSVSASTTCNDRTGKSKWLLGGAMLYVYNIIYCLYQFTFVFVCLHLCLFVLCLCVFCLCVLCMCVFYVYSMFYWTWPSLRVFCGIIRHIGVQAAVGSPTRSPSIVVWRGSWSNWRIFSSVMRTVWRPYWHILIWWWSQQYIYRRVMRRSSWITIVVGFVQIKSSNKFISILRQIKYICCAYDLNINNIINI